MNIFGKLFIGAVSLGAAAIATGILMKKKRENHAAHYSDDLPLHEDCCGDCGEDCCCNAQDGADDCCCTSCAPDQDESPAEEPAPSSTRQTEASGASEDCAGASEDGESDPEDAAQPLV